MKLPGYQSGGVQRLQTVSPSAYGARAQSARAISGAVSGLAGAVSANMQADRESRERVDIHAAKQAGQEQRRGRAELTQFLEENPYLDPDDKGHAEVLDGVDITNYARQPDGSIRTADAAADIFARRSQDNLTYLADNLREGRVKNEWITAQRAGIAKDTADLSIAAAKKARSERKQQTALAIKEANSEQDWAESRHQIAMGDFSAPERAELRREVNRAESFAGVDNALLARSIPAIDEQIAILSVPEKEYHGDLDTNERVRLVAGLEAAKQRILAGAGATSSADLQTALDLSVKAADSYNNGGNVTAMALAQTIDDVSMVTGLTAEDIKNGNVDLSLLKLTDQRKIISLHNTLNDVEHVEALVALDQTGRDQYMFDQREAAGDDPLRLMQLDRLEKVSERTAQRINDDAAGHAERINLVVPTEPFDINNIVPTMGPQRRAAMSAAEHFNVPDPIVSDAVLTQLQTRWQGSDITEQGVMIDEVNASIPDPTMQEELWKKIEPGNDATYLAGIEAYTPPDALPTQVAYAQRTRDLHLYGKSLLNDPNNKPFFEAKGWDRKEIEKYKIENSGDAAARFNDHGARLQAMERVATGLIMEGVSGKDAKAEAKKRVLGEAISNVGSRKHVVTPPVVNMPQRDFHIAQANIPDSYYESLGIVEKDIQEKVARGDLVYKDTGNARGEFHLFDPRDGQYVPMRVGDQLTAAVIRWPDAMSFEPDTPIPAGAWERFKYGGTGPDAVERKALAEQQQAELDARDAERADKRQARGAARETRIQEGRETRKEDRNRRAEERKARDERMGPKW